MNGTGAPGTAVRTTGIARFKQGMRCLVGSVNIVALQAPDGALMGLTATAVCSFSADPPSIVACINTASPLAAGLSAGARFSVSVLSESQQEIADAFGGRKGLVGRHRFAYGEWYRSEDDVPLLADARACLECRVVAMMDYGTHRAAIGAVTDVHLGYVEEPSLVFANGRYSSVS